MISVRRFVAVAAVTAIAALGATPAASSAANAPRPTIAPALAAGDHPKCPKGHGNGNQYPPGTCKAETDRSRVPRGGRVTVSGDGFYPGEAVSIALHSTLERLSTATAAADGVVTATVTIPRTLPAGSHRLVLTGMSSTNELTADLTVPATSRRAVYRDALPFPAAAVIPPAGAGLAMVLAGGLTLVGIRRRRRSRSIRV